MPNMMEQVKEFMIVMDQERGDTIAFRAELLRIRLILEEANETAQAIYSHDMPATVDGLCDQLYVILGTFIAFGFTPSQVCKLFDEVHRSNMAKSGGGFDAFGKVRKPDGWTPPDMHTLLDGMIECYVVSYESASLPDDRFYSAASTFSNCTEMIGIMEKNDQFVNIKLERR